jgi:hypothetical protein
MEAEWVKITPYLGGSLPYTAVSDEYPGVKESKEIYDYFQAINPKAPVDSFIEFYAGLSSIPRMGQSKMDQVMEAIRLRKLADKIHAEMDAMGIKR